VNVYVGKNDIIQEVLYKKFKEQDYIPILPKVFHNLFPNLQFLEVKEAWGHGNEWWKYLEVVEFGQGNRILFKFKRNDWRKMAWGVNRDNIAYTFAGMMIRKFGSALAIACLYPNTIKNLDDAANVMDVIHSLSMLSYKRNGYYEKEIEGFRDKLKEESKKIGFSPKYLSNDKCCEPCDVPEEDEGEGWAELPSNTVKVKGFIPQEIVDEFFAPVAQETMPIIEELDPPVDEPTMDELIQKRNEIMKEWSEKDKKDD
jgi:hypothetical protein